MLTFGSVCSGIEAASVAWDRYGWKAAWFAEVDRAASDVLAHRYPDVVNHGDMTLLATKVLSGEIDAPDILVGGTPCQAYSVAGRRQGLADARGQLTLSYVDLADAIDRVRLAAGKPPCIVVWENVPGVLTIKDNAFGCFLAGIAGEDDVLIPAGKKWTNAGAVFGPERAIAWRTLDAQYFGLAQRRRRVFVVASSREGFDPAAVLLEFEGVRRDSPPRRETGENIAGTLDARTEGGGFPGTDGACANHVVPAVRRPAGVAFGGNNQSGPIDVATARNAHAGPHGRLDFESETFILEPVQAYAFQPRIARNGRGDMGDIVNALTAQAGETGKGDAAPCVAILPFDTTQVCSPGNYSSPNYGDPCHPLAAGAHPPAICVTGDITHTLKAEGFDASKDGTGKGQPIVPCGFQSSQSGVRINDTAGTLDANYGSRRHNGVLHEMAVRRLTPVECERLQGFPDNHTLVPNAKGKPAADGPRYKQCGNSMAVAVMAWIGGRIKNHLDGLGHNGGPALDDFSDLLG